MEKSVQIRYHHVTRSPALEDLIRTKIGGLERFYRRITGCTVVVEAPDGHHRRGKGKHFRVRVELSVPGDLLVVGRDPGDEPTHEDPFLAVNDAFKRMRRLLQDFVRRRREVTERERPPHARVVRIFPAEGYGFLETEDGREIYFHEKSVLKGAFARLAPGMEVRYAEEEGEKGPQASTVDLVGA